jgi:hypothetical protein
MDDFVAFLVIGLVIIAALMAAFMVNPQWKGNATYVPEHTESIYGSYVIGTKDVSTFRPFDIGYFVADFTSDKTAYDLGNRIIKNGLLFGDVRTNYHISGDIEDLSVLFNVKQTNEYAPLVVKLNGATVVKDYFKEGNYTVYLAKGNLPDDVNIEISAESSGIRLWAPAYYELEDVMISSKGFSHNSYRYDFYLDEEFNTFSEGRLELNMDKNLGDIVITINDMLLYSGPVKNAQTFKFDKTYLQYGNNVLTISAKQNSDLEGHARMLVYYTTKHTTRMEVPFNINATEYSKMKNGLITFDITNVVAPGGFTVKIVSNNEILYSTYGTAGANSYSFDFSKGNIRQGTNYLVIQAIDNAVFAIGNIAVNI